MSVIAYLSRCFAQWRLAVAAVLLGAALPAHASNYFVGADSQCGYTTIAAAVSAAIASNGGWPKIYITSNQTYTNQAISISPGAQSHISLIGGIPNCGTTAPAGNTTINGGAGTSVITIRGAMSIVAISHLTITGGNSGDSGGGIDYAGTGYMNIDNSDIFSNTARDGGGIRFQGLGGAADLYLHANTFVTDNIATATGGGIRAEGQSNVHIDEAQVWIANNEAQGGYGGGIAVIGPATAHIGSPGYRIADYIGVIYGNTAQYGGGIAELANSTGGASVDLYATDANYPVRVEQNRAHQSGGGVYLEPYTYVGPLGGFTYDFAEVNLGGAHVDDNAAREGSGLYADVTSGTTGSAGGHIRAYAGHCAAGIECNTISNNRAVDDTDNPTAGSAILLQTDAILQAQQLSMRGNQGAHAIRVADGLLDVLQLDTCLLAGNAVSAELVTLGNAAATFNQCTFADNTIGGVAMLRAQTGFALTNSIVAQGSLPTLAYTGTGTGETLDYILSMETTTLSPGQHIFQGGASFVDSDHGDYRLLANSLAIDLAPAGAGTDRDLDGLPRDQDMPDVPNLDGVGVRDLGAYERQLRYCGATDSIYCDGFDYP